MPNTPRLARWIFPLLILLAFTAIGARGQKYTFNHVSGKVLDIPLADSSLRTITREGNWLHFAYDFHKFKNGGGAETGFSVEIVDSVWNMREKHVTYVLGEHWITKFDSCWIQNDTITLYNHTLDFLTYYSTPKKKGGKP